MPSLETLRLTWERRVLSILRIMVGMLYMEHGFAKILDFPHQSTQMPAPVFFPDQAKFDAVPAGASGRDFAVGEGAAAGRTVAAARTAGAGRPPWLRYCHVTFSPGRISQWGPHGGAPRGPIAGGLARRRSTTFRDGWTAWRRASRNPAAPRNAVSPWEAGAPRSAASRWEVAANPWLGAIARCSRTGSSNPSPSSGQSVSLPQPLSSVENPGFPRGCARLAWGLGSQRRAGLSIARQPAGISLSGHIPVPQCRQWGRR
jgi:hypothetical protein